MNHPGTPNINWSDHDEAMCRVCGGVRVVEQYEFIITSRSPNGNHVFTGETIPCLTCNKLGVSVRAIKFREEFIKKLKA